MTTAAGPEAALSDFLSRQFAPGWPDGPLGVAVSGGSDSLALLHLLAGLARGRPLAVATVDHRLRPEAAQEAEMVARVCAGLDLAHSVLRWADAPGAAGNLPDRARRARYDLLAGWAQASGIAVVALGHTRDDQAETVLMRLARGSGVDGLSGMAAARTDHGVLWLRPLLTVGRQDLRGWLAARGIGWDEDPTNADIDYDRVKARRALPLLAPLGLTTERLVATAGWMARAREVLEGAAADLALRAARVEAGDLLIEADALAAAPEETRLRLLAGGLRWMAGAEYRPRAEALRALAAEVKEGRARVLAGCLVWRQGGAIRIGREPAALAGVVAAPGAGWDGRWRLVPGDDAGGEVRLLGEAGLAHCPDWRDAGLPRATQVAGPALWRGGRLIAAPLAGFGPAVALVPLRDTQDFVASLRTAGAISSQR